MKTKSWNTYKKEFKEKNKKEWLISLIIGFVIFSVVFFLIF